MQPQLHTADIGGLITVFVWVIIMIVASIAKVVNKSRQEKETVEWEDDWDQARQDAGWDADYEGRLQRQRDTQAQADAQAQHDAWVDETTASAPAAAAGGTLIGSQFAREQAARDADHLRRVQEMNSSMPFDPTVDTGDQLTRRLELQRKLAARQAAAERAAQANATLRRHTPPDMFAAADPSPATPLAPQAISEIPTIGAAGQTKRKTWANTMSRDQLRRAVIMREVFDRPRCFDT